MIRKFTPLFYKSAFIALLSLAMLAWTTDAKAQSCPDGLSYNWQDMLDVFNTSGCTSTFGCHGAGASGLDLTSYAGFTAGGNQCGSSISMGTLLTDIIDVGSSCGADAVPSMNGFAGGTVDAAELAAIQSWIDSGALENCPSVTCPAYDPHTIDTQLLCSDGDVTISATETTGCAGGDAVTINYNIAGVAQTTINQPCGDIVLVASIAHSDPTACTPETLTVDFVATCDGDGAVKSTGSYDVEVWPTPTDGVHFMIPVAECAYAITDLCGDLTILYDDGAGGPIVNTSPPVAATPMMINYSVSFNGAPAACDFIGVMNKNCDGCPAFDASTVDAAAVCDGDVVTISANETTGCLFTAFMLPLTGTTDETAANWSPLTGRPNVGGTTLNGNNPPYTMIPFQVSMTGAYTINSAYDFDGYMLLYTDPLDLTVNPPTTYVSGDDDFNGTANSQIDNVLLNAGQNYYLILTAFGNASGTYSVTFPIVPLGGEIGESLAPFSDVIVDWSVNGVTQPPFTTQCGDLNLMATMGLPPNSCAPETQTITYSASCETNGSVVSSGTFDVEVWPTPAEGVHFTIPTVDCDATIVDDCGGALTILYDDGAGGPVVNSTPPLLNPVSGFIVNYSVAFTGAPASCTATGSYTAICVGLFTCPTFNGITADMPDVCNGETVCYTVDMPDATQPILLSENFDDCIIPIGWTTSHTAGDPLIVGDGDPYFNFAATDSPGFVTGGPNPAFSGCVAVLDDDAPSALLVGTGTLTSPVVDMSPYPLGVLSFDWEYNNFGVDNFVVEVFDGTAWVQVFGPINADALGSETISITPYMNANFQVRFVLDDGGVWGWGLAIDNVLIEQSLPANYSITWNTPVGATLVSGGTPDDLVSCYTLATNLTCGADIQSVPIVVDCVNNGVFDSNLFTGNTPNISVYGVPVLGTDFELPSEECNADIGNFCGNGLTVLYDDGAGGPIINTFPPIIIGATQLNYIVQSTGAPAGCGAAGVLNVPCGIPCPSYAAGIPNATDICDGETVIINLPELSGCLLQTLAQENFDACAAPLGWVTTHTAGDPLIAGNGNPYFIFNETLIPGGAGANPNFSGCIALLDDDNPGGGLLGAGTLTAPAEDLTPFNAAFLSFDWGYNNLGADNFTVEVFDGTAWIPVLGPLAADSFGSENIDVSAYINGNFQVRFVLDDGGVFAWGAAIDNYMIEVSIVSNVTVNWNLDAVGQPNINQACGDIELSTALTMTNPTGCVAEIRTIDYRAFCDDDGSEIATGNFDISVYPTPVDGVHYTLPTGGCDANITDLCGGLEILYDDGAGGTVTNIVPPVLVDGDVLVINYSIRVPGAPANCTVTGSFQSICITNLPCAVFNVVTSDVTNACDGGTVCYTVDLTDETQPILLSENFDDCAIPAGWTSSHTAGDPLTVGDGDSYFNFGTTDSPGFVAGGPNPAFSACVAVLDDDAPGSGLLGTGTLTSPIVDMSSSPSGTLSFDWEYNNGGTDNFVVEVFDGTAWVQVLGPLTADALGSETIDITPYLNAALQVRFVLDDGGVWGWGVAIDNVLIEQPVPANYNITWNTPAGATIVSGGGILDQVTCYQLATTACGTEIQNAALIVDCLDGNGAVNGNLFTGNTPDVTVYSTPVVGVDFTLPTAECDATIIDNCGDALTILYDDGFGGPVNNTTPPSLTTPSAVNYLVMVTGAPAGCEATGVMNVVCGSNCPVFTPATIDNLFVCEGDTVNVLATETSGCLSIMVAQENFDACVIPVGWTTSHTAGDPLTAGNGNPYFIFDETGVPGFAVVGGPNPAFSGCVAALDDDAPSSGLLGIGTLTAPAINLMPFSSGTLSFDWEHQVFGSESFYVEAFDGTAWVQVFGPNTTDALGSETIDITPYVNAAFQIRFVLDDGQSWGYGVAIDNYAIEATSISTVTVDWSINGAVQPQIVNQACGDVALAYTVVLTDPNGCAAETQTIAYSIVCDEEGTILDAGSFDVEVWPVPIEGVHYSLSTTDCDATITDLCGSALTIFYGDGLGGPVNNTTPPVIIASSLIDYSIKFTGDPSGCSGITGTYAASCNSCPVYDPPAINITEICTGGTVAISAVETTGCQIAFAPVTGPLTGATNETAASWAPLTGRPNVGGTTLNGNNPPYTMFPLQVDMTGVYSINSAWDFDGYLLLYTDPLDLTQNPPTTYISGDDDFNGIAESQIDNVTLNAGQNYYLILTAFGTGSGTYSVTFPVVPAGANVLVETPLSDSIVVDWTINGVAQAQFIQECGDLDLSPTLDMTDPNACTPEVQTIAYSATCESDGSAVSSGSFDVTLYPTPIAGVHFTLPTADCDATIIDECAGALTILYDDGNGGLVENPLPPVVVQGTSLTINYTVAYTGAPVACSVTDFYDAACIGNFVCPSFNSVTVDAVDACDGATVCYTVDLSDATQPILLNETFDDCIIPAGWATSHTAGDPLIIGNGDPYFNFTTADAPGFVAGGPNPAFSGCVAVLDDDAPSATLLGIGTLTSPAVDMSSSPSGTLSFDWEYNNGGTDNFVVEVFDGTAWVQVFGPLTADALGSESIDITPYLNAALQVRFVLDDGGVWGWGLAIDNVIIEQLVLTNFDVTWTAPPGATLVSGGGIGDLETCYAMTTALTCGSEVQNAPVTVNCSNNGTFDSELFNGNVPDVTVYGIPVVGTDFVLPTAECDAIIINNCGATILYDDGAGGPVVNTTPPTINGPTQVNYIVQSIGAPASCGTVGVLNVACGIPCPSYDAGVPSVTDVCDGEAATITVSELSGCLLVTVAEEFFDAPTCDGTGGTAPAGWTITHTETAGPGLGILGSFFYFDEPSANGAAGTTTGGSNPNFAGCIAALDDDAPGGGLTGVGIMTAPALDMTSFNSSTLIFDWEYNNGGTDNFTVEVFDGTTWIPVLGPLTTDGFGTANIDVSAYANAAFQVRFVLDDNDVFAWGAAIDNYQVIGSSVSDVTVNWSIDGVAQTPIMQGCGDVDFDVTLVHSDPTACTSETQMIDYTITCDEDADAQIAAGTYNIEVWPNPVVDVHYTLPVGCDAAITDLCTGALTILYDDGAGGPIVNTTPPVLTPPATINYSVNFTGAPVTCEVTGVINTTDITATATSNSPICEGDDLVLMETAGDGTSWSWTSDGAAAFDDATLQNPTASGAADGETFTVVVSDAVGCTATSSVSIVLSPLPVVSVNAAGPFCAEDTPVVLVGAPAGGTFSGGAYVDAAGNFDPALAAIGMNPVNYSVTQNGCTVDETIMVEVNQVTATATGTDASCDEANGTGTVTPLGGTIAADYTYAWDNGEATATASMLAAGTHTVTVTDDNGCLATAEVTIGGTPGVLIDAISSTDASCGGSDGTAIVTASGGTIAADYTYLWSDGQTTATITGLSSNTYTVTVTDDNGCTATASVGVNDAGAPSVDDITSTDAICGGSQGTATVTASGGTVIGTYTYQWDDAATQTTATATGLLAGTYSVTVSDDNACVVIATVIINDIAGPSIDNITSTDGTCGDPIGTATVTASGGTVLADYAYAWDNGETTAAITDLAAGTYTVTVTDDNGCTAISSVAVGDIAGPTIDNVVGTNTACGNASGTATVTAIGGTPAYTYLWDDGLAQTSATAVGLLAGTYNVTVTDATGCTATETVTLSDDAGPALALSATDATCGNSDGTATVAPTGGVMPYTYLWNDAATQMTATATGLPAGTYSVLVSDANGCQISEMVTVGDIAGPTVSTSFTDANCGGSDGTATAIGADGTIAVDYAYLWDDVAAQTTATATGLAVGTYNVTITDDNGCTAVSSATVGDVAAPIVDNTSATDATCGGSDGAASVTASGGTPAYTYLWSDGQMTATAAGLSAGTYNVTVTDANGCTATGSVGVNDAGAPTVDNTSSTDATCGGSDGTASVTASGGTVAVDYVYNWDGGQSTATATGLTAGNYNVTVTDDNGCSVIGSVSVGDIAGPTVSNIFSSDAACGGSDGSATVIATGGTVAGGYMYIWSDAAAQTTATATGLSAGTYNVTVTDDNGCAVIAVATVGDTPAPTVDNTSATDSTCGGSDGTASVTASGGTAPYSYLWSDGQTTATATGLSAGAYNVTVTDDNACTAIGTATVGDIAGPTIGATSSTEASCGNSDGTVTVMAMGGTVAAVYTYLWDDAAAQTTSTATGLPAGTYNVTVTDDNNCPAVATVTISDSDAPSVAVGSITDASCGESDGSISVTASGGTVALDYTYQWDDGQATATASGLSAGTYIVTVSDDLGCSAITSVVVGQTACSFINIVNNFEADDPCACNNDQSANGAGDGTFSETLTVSGPPNLIVQAGAASTGLGLPVPAQFTEVAPGRYELTFNHIDRVGFFVEIEFSNDGGAMFGDALTIGGDQLTFSNVCAYPVLDFVPLDAAYCGNDDPVTNLDVVETSTNVTFTPIAGQPMISIDNGIASLPPVTLDPGALTPGFHTIGSTYGYVAGTGMGGTVDTPAIAINSCLVNYAEIVEIYDLPSADADCSEDGLITLTSITAPSGDVNDLMYSFNGGAFGTATTFTVGQDGIYTVEIMDVLTGCIVEATANCLLPLELTAFEGDCKDDEYVLNWVTSTESNISHFEIERSTDGINFTSVGEVQAVGNSSTTQYYNFVDETSLLASYYYRLRIVELDGVETFSRVEAAECLNGEFGVVDIYPNPTDDEVVITYEMTQRGDVVFRLVDVLGRTLVEEVLTPDVGINTKMIDMSQLPSAMYFIILDNGVEQSTKKVVRK